MDELSIGLDNPININYNGKNADKKGTFVDVEVLTVPLPTVFEMNLSADIEGIVAKSLIQFGELTSAKSEAKEEAGEGSEKTEIPLIVFSATGNQVALYKAVNEYLVKICKWDDDAKIQKAHLDKLPLKEYKKIVVEVASFLSQDLMEAL